MDLSHTRMGQNMHKGYNTHKQRRELLKSSEEEDQTHEVISQASASVVLDEFIWMEHWGRSNAFNNMYANISSQYPI